MSALPEALLDTKVQRFTDIKKFRRRLVGDRLTLTVDLIKGILAILVKIEPLTRLRVIKTYPQDGLQLSLSNSMLPIFAFQRVYPGVLRPRAWYT